MRSDVLWRNVGKDDFTLEFTSDGFICFECEGMFRPDNYFEERELTKPEAKSLAAALLEWAGEE